MTPYYKPVIGGITTFVENLSEWIASMGAEVLILSMFGEASDCVRIGPKGKTAFVRWARRAIRRWKPDVVHANGHWYCLAPAFTRTGRRQAPRVLFTVHTVIDFRSRVRKLALHRLFGRADMITFVSEKAKADFVAAFGSPTALEVVYPGARVLRPSGTVASQHSEGRFRVLAVSMMVWPEKVRGLKLLLDAFAILHRGMPQAVLILAGDGELRPELEAHARSLGIRDEVIFAGVVNHLGDVFASSDVVCHVSFQDSFAQSVVEALALGIPVVVNEGVFTHELARSGDVGIFQCPSDAEAIADSLSRLAADRELRSTMGAQGQAFVNRHFSWSEQARRFWALYGIAVPAQSSR